MNPFMTFYTPTYKRPTFLAMCRRSVQAQTCRDFQHMVIVDDTGIGVEGMFRDIRRHADQIRGEYVFILADDDLLLDPLGLRQVRDFARAHENPPVIIVAQLQVGAGVPADLGAGARLYQDRHRQFHHPPGRVPRERRASSGSATQATYVFIHHSMGEGLSLQPGSTTSFPASRSAGKAERRQRSWQRI